MVTSGGQAEYGRALGGYINMVTKSGTNTFHGDGVRLLSEPAIRMPQMLSHMPIFRSTQSQYGASVGGPIVQGRTFYFANFEQRILNQAGNPVITITPANVTAINARLTDVGLSGTPDFDGAVSQPGSQQQLFWRRWIIVSAKRMSSALATASTMLTLQTRAAWEV